MRRINYKLIGAVMMFIDLALVVVNVILYLKLNGFL